MIVANKKFVVKLSSEERKRLSELISKGKSAAKVVLKARILLKADQSEEGECWTDEKICEALDTNFAMVTRVRSKLVWDSFGSWLRTIRPGIPPSELVVAEALRQTLSDFLLTPSKSNSLSKFIAERQDAQNMRIFRLAS